MTQHRLRPSTGLPQAVDGRKSEDSSRTTRSSMKFTAKIGKIKYELEETNNPKVLKLTKGDQVSFLPKELIVEYIAYKGGAKMFELTRDALSKALE